LLIAITLLYFNKFSQEWQKHKLFYTTAQHGLGVLYREGRGVAVDYGKSVYWHEQAAMQGDMDSQFDLLNMYLDGQSKLRPYMRLGEPP
jgi:TPR repeat protein